MGSYKRRSSLINVDLPEPFSPTMQSFFVHESLKFKFFITMIPVIDENSYIEFHNVSFQYPGSDIFAIKNLNLRLSCKMCIRDRFYGVKRVYCVGGSIYVGGVEIISVSYTHLDVYKRQPIHL